MTGLGSQLPWALHLPKQTFEICIFLWSEEPQQWSAHWVYSTPLVQNHPGLLSAPQECVMTVDQTHTRQQTARHSSHPRGHVDSHRAEPAHNEFEELHTYSKVIYFIRPIKGSDKIVALHCKSISRSPLFISHQDLQMAKLITQGRRTGPLSVEFEKGLISHKNLCLWKPSFPYHYQQEYQGSILKGSRGLAVSVLPLVQGLLGEYRCKYDLGLFLLWSWPPVIDTDTLAIWLALPAAWGHLTIATSSPVSCT